MTAIALHHISKCYPISNGGEKWALKDVSFEVTKGTSLGIIGHNGAGKSTLLKILSGITFPTNGEATVEGSFSSLLEVGTGFHPDLSGRDNIFLNGSIIGLSRKQIATQLEAIIAFSGVKEYIDEPLRTYSSGMRLRLAFSVIAHLTTDILALDEVLAVGDTAFQVQCMERIFALKNEGRTILFVSHNLAAVRQLCDRVFVLDNGRIVFDGNATEAIAIYTSRSKDEKAGAGKGMYLKDVLCQCSDTIATINIEMSGLPSDAAIDLGVNIADSHGNALLHFSSRFIQKNIVPQGGGAKCTVQFEHGLKPGNYPIHVHIGQNEEQLEWVEYAATLVVPPYNPYGFHNPEAIQAAGIRPFDITQL